MYYPTTHLAYAATDESLESIFQSLHPQNNARVLSICGSADQPFALLSDVAEDGLIFAIDRNSEQIKYGVWRKVRLAEGDLRAFLGLPAVRKEVPQPKNFHSFFTPKTFEKIRKRLDNIQFHNLSFEAAVTKGPWSHLYLSNITMDSEGHYWQLVADNLQPGGFVYHACVSSWRDQSIKQRTQVNNIPPVLVIDQKRTAIAQKYTNYYNPIVLQKI